MHSIYSSNINDDNYGFGPVYKLVGYIQHASDMHVNLPSLISMMTTGITSALVCRLVTNYHARYKRSFCSTLPSLTSMMTGATNLLSVTLVTTVSVNVLLVMVSVTLPNVVGASGNSMPLGKLGSGFFIVKVTKVVGSGAERSLFGRNRAGIIAWNSSLVMGFGSCEIPHSITICSFLSDCWGFILLHSI